MIRLEIHLLALKQMLSIWDNPSITKVRHCTVRRMDTVSQREKRETVKGFRSEISSVACQLLRNGKCI